MDVKKKINETAGRLENNYKTQGIFEIGIGEKLPRRSEIVDIINEVRRVIFPGYFGNENTAYVSLGNFAGNTLAGIYEKMFKQIRIALIHKDRQVVEKNQKNNKENNENEGSKKNVEDIAEEKTLAFLDRLPDIQQMIFKDVEAELEGDPAAGSMEDIIFSYPGIYAIFIYRIAHVLYELNVPYIPRIMTECAHSKTGIDINPGARIGEYFFIDHGTGIVIGETTEIGNHVKIYQGVTLGAMSTMKGQALSGVKRHPTIEDNVVIYANTTILGGETVIGKNSVVAGNAFVIESIPENTKVSAYMPKLHMKKR